MTDICLSILGVPLVYFIVKKNEILKELPLLVVALFSCLSFFLVIINGNGHQSAILFDSVLLACLLIEISKLDWKSNALSIFLLSSVSIALLTNGIYYLVGTSIMASQSLDVFNFILKLIVLLALLFRMLEEGKFKKIQHNPSFWMVSGLFMYQSCVFTKSVFHMEAWLTVPIAIQNFVLVTSNLFLYFGFYMTYFKWKKQQQISPSST